MSYDLTNDCPISADLQSETNIIGDHSQSIIRSFRRVRQLMNSCEICPEQGSCVYISSFHAVVSQAIDEIVEEWNLDD